MAKKSTTKFCSIPSNQPIGCCTIESVVSVDDRGQMVLPKELREKAHIKSGDKLAIIAMEKNGTVCCLSLIKVNDIEPMVKHMLGPLIKEIF